MVAVKSQPNVYRHGHSARRLGVPLLLMNLCLPILGCVVLAASAGAALLTGLFVGRLQASLAATARSYQYSEVGDVRLVFRAPTRTTVRVDRFVGRLPGFHLVFFNAKQGVTSQTQGEDEAIVYETDVEIDFSTRTPTLTGVARERDGDDEIPISELYPDSEVRASLDGPNAAGAYTLTITFAGTNEVGDELDYSLVLQVLPSAGQSRIEGSAEITRTFTPAEGEPEALTGDGSIEARRTADTDPDPAPPPNDNEANDNAQNDNTDNDNAGNDNESNDNEEPPPPPDDFRPSACFPGLTDFVANYLDEYFADQGREALDLNGNGVVTVGEVHDAVEPVLGPFGAEVTDEAASCVAELANET